MTLNPATRSQEMIRMIPINHQPIAFLHEKGTTSALEITPMEQQ
jgi:hypothetical protein